MENFFCTRSLSSKKKKKPHISSTLNNCIRSLHYTSHTHTNKHAKTHTYTLHICTHMQWCMCLHTHTHTHTHKKTNEAFSFLSFYFFTFFVLFCWYHQLLTYLPPAKECSIHIMQRNYPMPGLENLDWGCLSGCWLVGWCFVVFWAPSTTRESFWASFFSKSRK